MAKELKRFRGYTIEDLCDHTGLTRQGARHRLQRFVAGLITEDHLLRPAVKTRPRARR